MYIHIYIYIYTHIQYTYIIVIVIGINNTNKLCRLQVQPTRAHKYTYGHVWCIYPIHV